MKTTSIPGPIRSLCEHISRTVTKSGYYPTTGEISCPNGVQVAVGGRSLINFSSNDYLALSQHPKIVEKAQAALEIFGAGSGGSRLTAGTQSLHRALEERIASFKGAEAVVVFSSGYLVNEGVIPALTGVTMNIGMKMLSEEMEMTPMEIFFDELVHASIIDGLAVATSTIFRNPLKLSHFRNRDMARLEVKLARSEADRKLIITDGVFSLHGRIAPLREIVALAKKYGAEVYVDDAHGVGIIGENGRGTAELCGLTEEDIDFSVGTLSKAFGGSGGYITGSKEFCDYVRIATRSYMFQTSLPPSVAAGLIGAFDVIEAEPERRQRVLGASNRVRGELERLGFDLLGSTTHIIPICFKTIDNARLAAEMLQDRGIFAPPYYYPAVRANEAMVRINITAGHTNSQIDQLLEAVETVGRKLNVI